MANASLIKKLEVWEARGKAVKIELVLYEVEVDFTEKLVVLEVAEPSDPAGF